jgi:hypothetical protein
MKKIYLLISAVCFGTFAADAQTIWDNFEDQRKANYFFINGVFIPYNENPDQSGVNTSLVAAKYTRNSAELFDVIVMDGTMANVSDYINGTKQIKMDIWSPVAGMTVQITLENSVLAQPANYPVGRHSEHIATTTVANAWQTLTFNFSGQPDGSVANTNVNRMVLLFAPNTNTNPILYWDNLRGPELAADPCASVIPDQSIFNDFQCNQNVNFVFSHSGINFQRIFNPAPAGVNTSTHVARYVRNGGEEFDVIIGRFNGPLGLTPTSQIKLDVWDPNAPTTVLVSLQNANGDVILEMSAQTSASSQWQTLTYDPSSVSGATDITQFVILFDPGSSGSDEYFFDNFLGENLTSVQNLESVESFNAFPNPSQGVTTFQYSLRNSANVSYTIFDITGKLVDQQNMGIQPAGMNQINWSANGISNGLYFYTFNIDGQTASGKIILNK